MRVGLTKSLYLTKSGAVVIVRVTRVITIPIAASVASLFIITSSDFHYCLIIFVPRPNQSCTFSGVVLGCLCHGLVRL